LEVDASIKAFVLRAFDIYSKWHLRRLFINLVSKESDVYPRSRVITSSHQDNFFHFFNPQPKFSGEGKQAVDVLHHPPAKFTPCKSVFTPSRYRQG
jgi:hypothetical protein